MGVNVAPTFQCFENTTAMAHPDAPFSGMNDDDGSGNRLCSSEACGRRQRAQTQPPTSVGLESASCGGVPTYLDGWWVVHVVPQRADGFGRLLWPINQNFSLLLSYFFVNDIMSSRQVFLFFMRKFLYVASNFATK